MLIINAWQINKQAVGCKPVNECVPHVASGWPRSEPKGNYALLKSGRLAGTSKSEKRDYSIVSCALNIEDLI